MDINFEVLASWLQEHQHYILITIALTSFVESLAIVGIVVPGIALLFAAGSAAGSTGLDVSWVLLAAFTGSVAGDAISFFLGYKYHVWIRELPPFKRHPQWITRGEHFFQQYGLMGIVIGRFVGPIRPVMPLVAGFMQMRPLSFLTIDIAAALAWAPFYLMPGYLVGASLDSDSALTLHHLALLLGTLFAGWLIAQLLWQGYLQVHGKRNKLQLSLLVTAASLSLFVMLSQLIAWPPLIAFNQIASIWLLSLRHATLDIFFVGLTQFGYTQPMLLWAAAVTLVLAWQRNFYAVALWVGTTLFAYWLLAGMKLAFSIQRPPLVKELPESFAFPSGHTTMNLVFLGTLAVLCLPRISIRRQKVFLSTLGMLTSLIACSRLYLTVHWVTDIVGGLLLGGFVLGLLYTVVLKKPFHAIRPTPVIVVSIIAWLISFLVWVLPDFNSRLLDYTPLLIHG